MTILYHHRTRATDAQGIHINEMVKAMRGLGHTVNVAAVVRTEKNIERQGEPVSKRRLQFVPFLNEAIQLGYNVAGVPILLWKMWKTSPDLLYERYSLFNFSGVLAARLSGKPIVLEVNSPLALEQYREGAIRLYKLALWSERVIANLATMVVVVSTPLRKMMEANGIDPSKLMVLPNGIDSGHFRAGESAQGIRAALNLEGKVVVGFAGWFKGWHGMELLLEAFRDARLKDSGAILLLIGDGPVLPDLKAYVAKHGLVNRVIFTGPVPHSEVPRYLAAADIAVQPAANEYCCPMKILEYMGLGKAIVAPRQENILDLLREDEVVFFEPGSVVGLVNALASVIDDTSRREELGRGALRAIFDRGFLWSRNAEAVIGVSGAS